MPGGPAGQRAPPLFTCAAVLFFLPMILSDAEYGPAQSCCMQALPSPSWRRCCCSSSPITHSRAHVVSAAILKLICSAPPLRNSFSSFCTAIICYRQGAHQRPRTLLCSRHHELRKPLSSPVRAQVKKIFPTHDFCEHYRKKDQMF